MIRVYTDGGSRVRNREVPIASCSAVILREGQEIEILKQAFTDCTNNQMELMGVLMGLGKVYPTNEPVQVYSDSAYIVNCFKDRWYDNWRVNNWKSSSGKPVKNREMWELLLNYYENMNLTFVKVKGHSNDYYNDLADKAVNEAMDNLIKEGVI